MEAHTELVLAAGEECIKELKDAQKYEGVKEQADEVRRSRFDVKEGEGEVVMGMKVDIPGSDDGGDVEKGNAEGVPLPAKLPSRKTKQQRKKALQQKAEVRTIPLQY